MDLRKKCFKLFVEFSLSQVSSLFMFLCLYSTDESSLKTIEKICLPLSHMSCCLRNIYTQNMEIYLCILFSRVKNPKLVPKLTFYMRKRYILPILNLHNKRIVGSYDSKFVNTMEIYNSEFIFSPTGTKRRVYFVLKTCVAMGIIFGLLTTKNKSALHDISLAFYL